jgi:hypothetical protein
MKKYITKLIVGLIAITSVSFSQTVSATAGFESDYVFRGVAGGTNVGTSEVTVNLPSKTSLSVVGLWDFDNLNTTVRELDVALTQGYAIDKATTLKVGGVGYFYPKAAPAKGETNYSVEVFGSLAYDAFLSPTVAAGYDLNLRQVFAEGSLSQPINLFLLAKGFKLVPAATLGWVGAKDALPERRGGPVKDSYYYLTGKLDLVYEAKNVVVGAGYRHNYLNNSVTTNNSWLGGFVTVKF